MTEIDKSKRENSLHPVGQNFLVQCVGYRGLAHRNRDGEWKIIFSNRTLPEKLSFLPPVPTTLPTLPDVQPDPLIVARPVLSRMDPVEINPRRSHGHSWIRGDHANV